MKRKPSTVLTTKLCAAVRAEITPEFLARLDALTDEDIAVQIAANPDAVPELDQTWFESAQLTSSPRSRIRSL